MLPPLLPKMLFIIATVALFLMMSMPGHEGRILHGEEQNLKNKNQFLGSLQGQAQVPPISLPKSNPSTTTVPPPPQTPVRFTTGDIPPWTISQKALASDDINYVSSLLRRAHWAPLHVIVPPSAPNPGTYIPSSTRSQRKSPPHSSMAYYVPPLNPGSHIPASTSSHNTAPSLGSP